MPADLFEIFIAQLKSSFESFETAFELVKTTFE
jgi:hypothetical protein